MDIQDLQRKTQREARHIAHRAACRDADKGASRRALLHLTCQLSRFGGTAAIGLSLLVTVLAGGLVTWAVVQAVAHWREIIALDPLYTEGVVMVCRVGIWLTMVSYGVYGLALRARRFVQGQHDTSRFLNWRADYTAQVLFTGVAIGCGAFMLTPDGMAARHTAVIQGGLGFTALGLALGQCHHRAAALAVFVPAGALCLGAALYDGAQLWGSMALFAVCGGGVLGAGSYALYRYACHLSVVAVRRYPALTTAPALRGQGAGYNPYKLKRQQSKASNERPAMKGQ